MNARKQMRLAKERGIGTEWYRQNINIRRQEYAIKVKEHNEKKFSNFIMNYRTMR